MKIKNVFYFAFRSLNCTFAAKQRSRLVAGALAREESPGSAGHPTSETEAICKRVGEGRRE